MNTEHSVPVTSGDFRALAGYALLAGVLLSPLRHYVGPMAKVTKQKNERDSFPLSTYPMFSADRRGRVTVPHVVGISAVGERIIPHYSHYGAGGLNQVRRQISRGIREGRATDIAQCYADSLATRPRDGEEQIVMVQVIRARFLFADYFNGDHRPAAESLHASCLVGGTAQAGPGTALPRHKETQTS